MFSRPVTGLILAQFFAAALAFGQQVAPPSPQTSTWEFGHASGGEINATPRATNEFSFSLGMSMSRGSSSSLLPGVSGRQYTASGGGAIVPDRLWFFGSGQFANNVQFASPAIAPRFTNADIAKVSAQVSDRQAVTGFATTLPSSFQSLHFTGMLSNSSFFTVNASRETAKPALVPVVPAQ